MITRLHRACVDTEQPQANMTCVVYDILSKLYLSGQTEGETNRKCTHIRFNFDSDH